MSPAPGSPVVYGAPLPGRTVVDVPVEVAPLFAAAHHRLRPETVAVHLGDGEVHVVHAAPTAPDGGPDRWVAPAAEVVAAVASAVRPIVLAGPDVVRHDAVAGLHALAAALGAGVLNTWGAKGVFDWRSRHHLATVGLQARDLDLAGLDDADLIVTTGIDPAELPPAPPGRPDPWRGRPVVDVHPWGLGPLAEQVGRAPTPIAVPPLREGLAAATQAGWARDAAPLPPSRVTRAYGAVLAAGGVVAADPGVAGFWVARTLPTTARRGVIVPAEAEAAGSAIATAAVARLLAPGRPALAVVDDIGDAARRCLDAAARLGVAVAVERWVDAAEAAEAADGADRLDAAAHATRLDALVADGGHADLAVDTAQIDRFVAVAGPVTAWGGRTTPGGDPGPRPDPWDATK